MNIFIHPTPILLAGALLLPVAARFPLRGFCLMLAPLGALGAVLANGGLAGRRGAVSWMGWDLVLGQVDGVTAVFALALGTAVVLATLYGLESTRRDELAAGWIAAGGGLGVAYSGDWLGLFCFWSMWSLAPAFLIWSGAGGDRGRIGLRHALLHAAGAFLLLVGILLRYRAVGDFVIGPLATERSGAAPWLMLSGLAMGAAAFPLHCWLPTGFATTSPFGMITMTLGVTAALHAVLRCGAGVGALVVVGLAGVGYALTRALRAGDLRRLCAWTLMAQSGFALALIGGAAGYGEALAQGVALHATAASLAACLLALAAGAIEQAAGSCRLDELGRLCARMPALSVMVVAACLAFTAAPLLGALALDPIPGRLRLLPPLAAFCALLVAIRLLFCLFGKPGAAHPDSSRLSLNIRVALGLAAALCVLVITAPAASPAFSAHLAHGLALLVPAVLAFVLLRPLLASKAADLPDIDRLFGRVVGSPLRLLQKSLAACERRIDGGFVDLTLAIRRVVLTWREFEREWLSGAVELLADAGLRALAGRWRRLREGPAGRAAVQALLPAALLGLALLLHLAR